jgi:hypothetical protein
MDRKPQSLIEDRSGAVVLVAVFMAVFLTGVLWYSIGLGNAVIYRETMLDGADATAYAAAVYDARGMNMIAMINLIMAAIMAILIVVKIIQAISILINVILCAVCLIPFMEWACPLCADDTAEEPTINNFVNRVQQAVSDIEPVLNKTSTIVALGMPWIAEVRSVAMATNYEPVVHGGITIAYAQLPGSGAKGVFGGGSGSQENQQPTLHHVMCCDGWQNGSCTWEKGNSTGTLTKAGKPNMSGCCSHHSATPGGPGVCGMGGVIQPEGDSGESSSKSGGRIGLPVQDDDPNILCKAGSIIVADVVHEVLKNIPVIGHILDVAGSWVMSGIDSIVNAFPGYFCGMASAQQLQGDAQNAFKNGLKNAGVDPTKVCSQSNVDQHNQTCQQKNQNCTPKAGQTQCCPTETVAQCKANLTGSGPSSAGATASISSSEATKKLVDKSKMGDDDFAVFSIVWGDLGNGPEKGVSMASWGRGSTQDPSFLTKISYSKAEFYYDIGTGMFTFQGANSNKAQQIPDDAMWNMRWRARLRRMHDPIPQVGQELADAVNQRLDSIGQDLGKVPGFSQVASSVIGDITSWVTKEGQSIDQGISNQIGSWLGIGTFAVVH